MKFRPHCEWLETRENPSGPTLLDPTAPIVSPDAVPPTQPVVTQPTPIDPIINPNLISINPWGG